jgi:hypothetical protein
MILYFKKNGGKREIGQPKDVSEALSMINKFCEKRNFHIYYTRMWTKDSITTFDVGSHTEFFILEDI